MAVDHYENFPVASLLLPARLRAAVRDIYRFARTADDIADEGDAPPDTRLAALAQYGEALDMLEADAIERGPLPFPHVFVPLETTVRQHELPIPLLRDLLSAFEQDIGKHRYENDTELFDYCRRSADPVGRLLLHLYECHEDNDLRRSDSICTGLQLTNFWQDVAVDWHKDRIYLPRDKRDAHGVTEDWIGRCAHAGRLLNEGSDAVAANGWHTLMQQQVEQARGLLLAGEPLTRSIPFRAGLELRLVIQGGLKILQRLDQLHYDVFERRPVLRPIDWVRMAFRALFR